MLVYPSAIDLSSSGLRLLSRELAARRRRIGTRWRRLTCRRQALLALAHLRCGDTYAQLAAGFNIGIATVYRYITEAVEVLAKLAPTLEEAVTVATTKPFVILDGTLVPIDRSPDPDHDALVGRPEFTHRPPRLSVHLSGDRSWVASAPQLASRRNACSDGDPGSAW